MNMVESVYQLFFFKDFGGFKSIDEIIMLEKPWRQKRFIRWFFYTSDIIKNLLPSFFVFHLSKRHNFEYTKFVVMALCG